MPSAVVQTSLSPLTSFPYTENVDNAGQCSSPMVPFPTGQSTTDLATERYHLPNRPLSPMLKTVLTPSPL
ncbi:MAG: hypothetical protein IPH45_21715 [Bacteroidales bacterium]|nr:hypothetical protein [Bacteroidales bacterium]